MGSVAAGSGVPPYEQLLVCPLPWAGSQCWECSWCIQVVQVGLGTEEPLMCSWVLSLPLCCCPQQVLGTPEDLDVPAVPGTCYCWLSPSLAGTTMAPAASEPPGHTVTAPVMPSGMGTGGFLLTAALRSPS